MCKRGLLSGHKITGVRMTLKDGAHHIVDSSEWSFYQAAQGALQDSFDFGSWQILEPIMLVEVTAPQEYQVIHFLIKNTKTL